MALTMAFKEAVSQSNLLRVRIMMKDSLWADPTFAEFNEMEKAVSSLSELYVPHDGKEFQNDKTLWTQDYLNHIMSDLMFNFSRERILHIKEVISYLVPDAEVQKEVSEKKSKKDFYKIVAVSAVSGIAAGGTAAVLTADMGIALSAVSGGILIGGAVGYALSFASSRRDKNEQ